MTQPSLTAPWRTVYAFAAIYSSFVFATLCWELFTTGDVTLPVRAAPERISAASLIMMLAMLGSSAAATIHGLVRHFRNRP